MLEALVVLIDKLFFMEDNPNARRRWRLTVALVLLLVGFHVAWACGFVPGLDGFARADSVAVVKSDVAMIRTELLEQRLFETRVRQCTSTTSDARQYHGEKLQELRRTYYSVTGHDYPVPTCEEVK